MSRCRCLLAATLAFVVLSAAGCFSYSPSRHARSRTEQPLPELNWPRADAAPLERVREATPAEVYRARPREGKTAADITDQNSRELVEKPSRRIVRNEMVDGCLVRMLAGGDEISWTALLTGFYPNGYVLSVRDLSPGRQKLAAARSARIHRRLNAMWEKHGIQVDPTDDSVALEDGVPFRIPGAVPEGCRGVMVHLWALAGNEYERRVAETLAARGWFIVDVKPGIGAPAELREDAVDQILALEDEQSRVGEEFPPMVKGERASAYQRRLQDSSAYKRYQQIGDEITDLRNPAVPLCSTADLPTAAAELAGRIDAVLADNARAAAAALETAYRLHPSLRGMPVVVAGFSAGAISTPTVAAMIKPDAAVIVGGAANAVGIANRSEFSRGGVRLSCNGKAPAKELVHELETAYLSASRLDPYHTAPLLASIPVLVVDAGMDTWVPSDFGEVLHERLGRPDRLHMALGGHGMLFYFLPGRAGWIADWMDRSVRSQEGTNTR
jgi:hypothetical protein